MRDEKVGTIYGPVKSWRLGWSLGVDVLLVDSICSFQCVYCQLGKIHQITAKRKVFVPTERVIRDLKNSNWEEADVITFSGSGEPTLAENLGEIIQKVKKLTNKTIVVLTNSTLLYQYSVRKELLNADKVFCKLDAWSADSLQRFNHPEENISLEKIVNGIYQFRQEYNGFLAIQTMTLRRFNNVELERLAEIYRFLMPDEVQLNLPNRGIPKDYSIDTRGNEVKQNQSFKKLKTISKDNLERIRMTLHQLTDLPIIAR